MLNVRLALAFSSVPTLAPVGAAQQASSPAPAYTPTSLAVEPGLPRTPDGRPDFQGEVWVTDFFPVCEASPLNVNLVASEDEEDHVEHPSRRPRRRAK